MPYPLLAAFEILDVLFVNAAGGVAELGYLIEVVAHHTHLPNQLMQLWQLQPKDYFLQSEIPEKCAGIGILRFLSSLLNLLTLMGGHIKLDGVRAFPAADIISPLRLFVDFADGRKWPFQKKISAAP